LGDFLLNQARVCAKIERVCAKIECVCENYAKTKRACVRRMASECVQIVVEVRRLS